MGGIKNKLKQLSNNQTIPLSDYRLTSPFNQRGTKNTTSKGSLWVRLGSSASGTASRRTLASKVFDDTVSRRLTEGSPKSGSRLPSFSQPSEMPDGQIGNTRKFNHLGLSFLNDGSLRPTFQSLPLAKGRQMSVAHRWGRIAKYTSITCLTLAILSTLVLNIVSSYSYGKVNSNAEPVSNGSTSTLANTELDPAGISISISSHSATGDTNDGNLSLSIPQGGGLVAGRHTVSINAGNEIANYSVFLNGGTNENGVDNTDLVNTMADSLPSTGSLITNIPSLSWSSNGFGRPSNFPMYGNGWGVALPDSYTGEYHDKERYETLIATPATIASGAANYLFSGIPPLAYGQDNSNSDKLEGNKIIVSDSDVVSTPDIYYGVKVDNPSTMLAGDYTANVVYTVIAELKTPGITSISPNPIRTGTSNRITIKGHNLSIVSKVTIYDRGTIRDCTNITHSGTNNDTTLTCTLPAISNTGTYVITAETEGGQTTTTQIQAIPPVPVISGVSPFTTEIGSSGTTLTISGENFIDVQYVYVDFNGNGVLDSSEQCQSLTVASNTQLSCIAPEYSTTGVYDLIVVAAGGISEPSRYSYVEPEKKAEFYYAEPESITASDVMVGGIAYIQIYGANLDGVKRITLSIPDSYVNSECNVTYVSSEMVTCSMQAYQLFSGSWSGSADVQADFRGNNDALLLHVDKLVTLRR